MHDTKQRQTRNASALAILTSVAVFSYIDRTLINVLQVPIKRELGLTDATMGFLTGLAFALLYALTPAKANRRVAGQGRVRRRGSWPTPFIGRRGRAISIGWMADAVDHPALAWTLERRREHHRARPVP